MKIIVKFASEIFIKSRSVRIFFVKVLIANIKLILKKNNKSALIIRYWDYLEIEYDSDEKICFLLQNIPGIHHFLLVKKKVFNSLQDIYEKTVCTYSTKLENKTFCVRVKRCGNHDFTSQDVERYLGKKICKNINNTCVRLIQPEKIIYLEIKDNFLFIVIQRYEGLGGLPIGTQQELLSLISGGFDSAVSSYMLIRRGCKVHYCFFNFGGAIYNEEVCKIAYYLWNRFSASHRVKFISVDFSEVIKEMMSTIKKNNQIGIILKRMMIRAASLIAVRWNINALLTGEVLGQVSSQTLSNLTLIDYVSNCMIFRPLIACDKEMIITLAKKIGTEEFSKVVPEYCSIISKKSTTKTTKKCIESEESCFDFMILDRAISSAYIIDITDIPLKIINQNFYKITTVRTTLCCDDIVLDIRSEDEQQSNPLYIANIEVKNIPFYKLSNQFSKLDQSKTYLLYCSNGVMSKLQAIHLYKQGFVNVKIYCPHRVAKNA